MAKNNQYYSERNDAPDDHHYSDYSSHRTDGDRYYQSRPDYARGEDSGARTTAVSNDPHYQYDGQANADQWHDYGSHNDHYLEPYFSPEHSADAEYSDHRDGDYYASDSERGFNQLFDSALEDSPAYADGYSDARPHDNVDLVAKVTAQNKRSGIQVYADDLVDIPRKKAGIQIPKTVSIAAFACFCVALYLGIKHFSKPDLSAYDIVQLESYEGAQKAPTIFNLADLNDCTSPLDCNNKSLRETNADIADNTQFTNTIREVPASAADTLYPSVTLTSSVNSSLEQRQVRSQWSNVRQAPGMSGRIITALPRGALVTILGTSGNWYEIQALEDGQQLQGFMHSSTVRTVTN